jgi:hypothetical protein
MSSKTEIANRVLSKTGDRRVSNIETDPSERAQVINSMYEIVRDNLLQQYPWNFAIKRASIAADGIAPAWGYSKRYLLPTDFLSLLSIYGSPDYRVEGGYILTNEGAPLKIKYVKKITSEGSFDAMFTEVFACELAVECSERINASNSKKQILGQQRDAAMKAAFASDAIQDPPQELQNDEWLLSRDSSVLYDDIDYNV